MEPITTTAIILVLTNLATKGLEKAFETGGEKISEGAINWIKSLFYINDKPKKTLKELEDNPDNEEKQNMARAILENSIEGDPEKMGYLKEIIKKMSLKENVISESKNINIGNINSGGGSIVIGDKNTLNK